MNINHPERIDRLASEYVVGTLRGRARRRFERMMAQAYHVRAAVWRWERELTPLLDRLLPQAPRATVWATVADRIGRPRPTPLDAGLAWWGRVAFWRGWSVASSGFAAALLVALLMTPSAPPQQVPERIAVIADNATDPQWLVRFDSETGKLTSRALNALAQSADRVYELWMLPTDGTAPRSLGLMPVSGGETQAQLSPFLVEQLRGNAGLAISVEPLGGSPTGLPTGPVVFQARLIPL